MVGHTGHVLALAVSSDGKYLVSNQLGVGMKYFLCIIPIRLVEDRTKWFIYGTWTPTSTCTLSGDIRILSR